MNEMCDVRILNYNFFQGAGDCFLGALAYFLAYYPDWPLSKTVTNSCCVASLSVQRTGTQTSFPHKHELESNLFV